MEGERKREEREKERRGKGIEVVGKRNREREREANACERAQDQKREPLTHLPVSGLRQPTPDWELGQLPTANWELTDYKSSARGCRRAASKVLAGNKPKVTFCSVSQFNCK